MNRRTLVQTAVAAGVFGGTVLSSATDLPRTPRDFTGPFYPRGPRNQTNDLIKGEPRYDILQLSGRVLTPDGTPYTGTLVDIWHADPQGRYKHPRDRRQDDLLEEFLYWGEATTDENGRFTFRTYIPGNYAARPAQHIHYKVWRGEREILTSQIYFEELGGAKGLARSSNSATLQTVKLVKEDDDRSRSAIDIVI